MPNQKISQLTPKGSALVATDLLEVSVYNGTTYDTRSVTGANVVSGLQPTLVSGTNIKTINSTSLLGSGNIVISTGLTVGTTPITSGTDTRLLFQNGGVLQQSANFTYDASLGLSVGNNTVGFVKTSTQNISGANVGELTTYSLNNFPLVKLTGGDLSTYFSGRIGLYYGNTEKAYLKASATGGEIGGFNSLLLKAAGALSTDYWQRTLNSGGTINLFRGSGDGSFQYKLADNFNLLQFGSVGQFSIGYNSSITNASDSDVIIGKSANCGTVAADSRVIIGVSAKVEGYYGVAVGGNTTVTGDGGVAIGKNTQVAGNSGVAIGYGMRATGNRAVMLGAKYGGTADNNIDDSFMLHLNGTSGGNYQHFFVNGKTNVVLKTNTQLTAGTQFEAAATNCITTHNGTAPTVGIIDASVMYSADIVAGNAAPHFRTENGAVVKIYQQTTAVTSATVVSGSGGNVKHDDTFDGYTVEQVVKALRNTGLLQ